MNMSDDEEEIIQYLACDYEIGYMKYEVIYDEEQDVVLNLKLKHTLWGTKLDTLDGEIIKVGPFTEIYDKEVDPVPNSIYTIRFPADLFNNPANLKSCILNKLPDLGGLIDVGLDVTPLVSHFPTICHDSDSLKHPSFIIYGELILVRSEIYFEKNVLEKVYVFDYDDEYLNCAICLNGLAGGIECSRTLCSHVFHKSCLFPWMMKSNTCPMCRDELVQDTQEICPPDLET